MILGPVGALTVLPPPHCRPSGPYSTTVLTDRMNVFTGEWLALNPPVEIHTDDIDWLERLWEESDRLDYEIWRSQ